MASNKNAQNSAPHDLKRTNCTINLPLVFTILVYIVSGESLKVFFECFIFTCHKIACKLTYVEACSDRGKSGIHSVIMLSLEIKTKYLNTI